MIRIAAGLFGLAAAAGTAAAGEPAPMQATSIALGDVTGVAYYTISDDGYQVVATLADGEARTPMRVKAMLSDGERMVLSVPQAEGQESMDVEIARVGDAVLVSDADDLMN